MSLETKLTDPSAPPTSRERLLAACERIIIAAGVSAVSARNLAREAGVNLSMISYNFSGIDTLLLEVAIRNLEAPTAQVWLDIEGLAGEPRQRLEAIIRATLQALWTPAVHCGIGRASAVIEAIYGQASEVGRAELADRVRPLFLGLVDRMAPLLPHLPRAELMLRLTCIGGAIRSMAPRNSAWDVYFEITGAPNAPSQDLVDAVTAFSLAALSVGDPGEPHQGRR